MQYGRKQIFTDYPEITSENLIEVLQQAMIDFIPNAEDCEELIKFEKGIQPLQRVKTFRKDINVEVVDNIANEITNFKVNFNWQPITLIQRGEKDSGNKTESEAVSLLNECYEAEEIKKKTQALARFTEITGIGYSLVELNTESEDEISPFKINILDPRCAFVVRSNYYTDHRIVLGVTFRCDSMGNTYFTCYTKHQRFEVLNTVKIINGKTKRANKVDEWNELERSGEENPLHCIPIIEWIRDFDRMGCFERQISEMNNLNLMISDFSNSLDGNVQAIWWTNDVEFPTDEDGESKKPKSGEWMQTYTPQDGKSPIIQPLSIDFDYPGIISQISNRRASILQKCNVPQRSEANNSTGIAVSDSSGWTDAEIEASRQDQIMYGCKQEELKCVFAAIKENAVVKVDERLLKLKYKDVSVMRKRQKNYELSVKSATLKNLLSCGIHGLHALSVVNMFEDVNQVYSDSKELIEKYQSSLFDKQNTESNNDTVETTDGGYEAQIENSPRLDGQSKERPINSEKEL